MSPWLRWSLIATLALSGAALLWPGPTARTVGAAVQRNSLALTQAPATVTYIGAVLPGPLPAELPHSKLDNAIFDPFVGVQPPPPPAPPAPRPFVGPIYEPPPPPPAIHYRYLGQMTGPSGERFVYLTRGQDDVPVAVGTHLDEGYVVEAINADGVHLYYPPLKAHTVIPVAPAATGAAQITHTSP